MRRAQLAPAVAARYTQRGVCARSRVPLPPHFLSRQLDRPAAVGGAKFISASAWRLCLIKFLAQMNPAADVLAMASLEVDISKLSMGECITVKWRGKPVFIRSRTEDEIAEAADVNLAELRDPENDLDRVQKPETLARGARFAAKVRANPRKV